MAGKRTPKIEAEILARMSKGEPLARICCDPGMPTSSTWREWCRNDSALEIAHGRARDDGFDLIAAHTLLIADSPMEGIEKTIRPDGSVEEKRGDMLGHRKLQIETRLKLLAKWDPRRYGDKLQVGGAEDLPPLGSISDAELDARIKAAISGQGT